MKDIETKMIEILQRLGTSSIESTSMSLVGDLAFDSLRMVTLLIMIEDAFEIELDESDMNPFRLITVEDVIRLIEKYVVQTEEENNG